MYNTILFPSDFFNKNTVDEELREEYEAVVQTGKYDVLIFSYEDWFENKMLKINKKINEPIYAVYRGWMMKADMYELFYNALSSKQIYLVTSPSSYEKLHLFPNAYDLLKEDTAMMKTYPLHQFIDVEELKQDFDKFMVKDYVKSVKGTCFPKFFDRTITQLKFDDCMKLFYQYRGKLLTGGICIKEYLDLKQYDRKTNEYRVFYVNHKIATVSRNSQQIDTSPKPPNELIEKYSNLDSFFYTIDYAQLDNNQWKIIECGDGQVSGLSDSQDYERFYEILFNYLNEKY